MKKNAITVGQFIHRKGFGVLLNAGAKCNKEYELYIIGATPTKEYLDIKEKLHLENVHFEGFKTKEEFEQIVYDINNPPLTEEQRIQQIESKCNQLIEAVYPIYKQINITNLLTPYTEEDRKTMKAFIDSSVFLGLNTHYFAHLENGEKLEIVQESKIDNIIPKAIIFFHQ